MLNLKRFMFLAIISVTTQNPAAAQTQPSEQTTALVAGVSETFFDLLPQHDFATERAFMSDSFAQNMPLVSWQNGREQFVAIAGKTPRYIAHGLTYYQQDTLLAAVDFSGQATQPDMFICGYILWEISDANTIGFGRLEQNIVSVPVFQNMPVQQAAQLMSDWRCPVALVEMILQVTTE